jgi:hypothetical protein
VVVQLQLTARVTTTSGQDMCARKEEEEPKKGRRTPPTTSIPLFISIMNDCYTGALSPSPTLIAHDPSRFYLLPASRFLLPAGVLRRVLRAGTTTTSSDT